MALDLDMYLSVRAYALGQAQLRARRQRHALQRHAFVLAPLALAGEDTTIHILACGWLGRPPVIQHVPDPRYRDDQYELFRWLADHLEHYFQRCRDMDTFPQLVVPAAPNADHLDVLADRLRYNQQDARVQRFGTLLSYATERYPHDGQQALITATDLLTAYWATGQQPGEDGHLGALLAWVDPPAGAPILDAVAAAEREPMGARTDPDFDRATLMPLVQAYNRARRAGAPAAQMDRQSARVRAALVPVVTRIYDATQRAIALVQALGLPPLTDLDQLVRRETDEFRSFMASRDAGYYLTLRDRPKAAAFKLAAREDAVQNLDRALLLGDPLARSQGILDGRVLVGAVTAARRVAAGPSRVTYHLDLTSTQAVLHLRLRDELAWADDPRLRLVVTTIRRVGTTTHVGLQLAHGQRAVGLPPVGTTLELVPDIPDWTWLGRQRKQMATRLAVAPWTHGTGGPPTAVPQPTPPADPLAAVEALT